MRMYSHRITVEGNFQFPIDMLRYDECHPAGETDSGKIMRTFEPGGLTEKEKILVIHHDSYKHWEPTRARWGSFGWTVVDHTVITQN